MIIWLNGDLIDEKAARIDPTDRGFLLGDGLFETMAIRDGKIVFDDLHFDRLQRGASILDIEVPMSRQGLVTATTALLTANDQHDKERASVRLTLTRGPAPRGLAPAATSNPTLVISCFPAAEPRPSVSAIIATGRRNEFSPTANVKALPYLDQIMARQEAARAGADDAILINTNGKVACATAANIFLWDSNTLITPPLKDGCLDGTTRRIVLKVAQNAGIDAFEESITPSTLANVESAFLTNSLTGLQSLEAIDGRALTTHLKMNALRTAFDEAARKSISA